MAACPNMMGFLNNLAGPDLLVIGIIALLIFGKRLPEVGRSLGKGIMEFKKGLADAGDELRREVPSSPVLPAHPSAPTASPAKPDASPDSGQTTP